MSSGYKIMLGHRDALKDLLRRMDEDPETRKDTRKRIAERLEEAERELAKERQPTDCVVTVHEVGHV